MLRAIARLASNLGRATVWAPRGVPEEHWRFRGIFRVVLPVTDVLFLYFGIVGYFSTVASVENAAGQQWQAWWSLGLAASAFGCLVGVAFPRLYWAEVIAKLFLVGHVSAYILLQIGRILDPQVSAVAGLLVILILTPMWRISDIGGNQVRQWMLERQVRHDDDARDARG